MFPGTMTGEESRSGRGPDDRATPVGGAAGGASEGASGGAAAEDHIAFHNVNVELGERMVIKNLSCRFPKGKITVILGGSGSGKSTTLRLIGGLIQPLSGKLVVAGTNIAKLSPRQMGPVREKLGMMFQGGALLDSTNVFDNVALPLREHTRMSEEQVRSEVNDCLRRVGLKQSDGLLLPRELSGGMVKRVALARAIITKPEIVMCDEPFSGLDPITTKRIELLFKQINKDTGMTMLIVSHDAAATLRLADHLLILMPDRCVEGPPETLRGSSDPRVKNLLSTDVDEDFVKLDKILDTDAGFGPGDLESTWS